MIVLGAFWILWHMLVRRHDVDTYNLDIPSVYGVTGDVVKLAVCSCGKAAAR